MDGQREESALNMFRQMDLRGKVQNDTQLKTVHQNTISTIRAYESSGDTLRKFSSTFSISLAICVLLVNILKPAELMVVLLFGPHKRAVCEPLIRALGYSRQLNVANGVFLSQPQKRIVCISCRSIDCGTIYTLFD